MMSVEGGGGGGDRGWRRLTERKVSDVVVHTEDGEERKWRSVDHFLELHPVNFAVVVPNKVRKCQRKVLLFVNQFIPLSASFGGISSHPTLSLPSPGLLELSLPRVP